MKINFYTTAAEIRSEISDLKIRQSALAGRLGQFWEDNDNDAYSIVRPDWVTAAEAEYEDITSEMDYLGGELAKVESREAYYAHERAAAEDEKRRADFAREESAVAAADPEQLWAAVNAASGTPALSRAFIGSAHVRRIALRLGLLAQSPT